MQVIKKGFTLKHEVIDISSIKPGNAGKMDNGHEYPASVKFRSTNITEDDFDGTFKENEEIIELVEKPETFVSDEAVIGIYYFKEVGDLKNSLQFVLDNEIINGGEYQINDGIKDMMSKGKVFKTGTVEQWMDCGNKKVTVQTNAQVLDNEAKKV